MNSWQSWLIQNSKVAVVVLIAANLLLGVFVIADRSQDSPQVAEPIVMVGEQPLLLVSEAGVIEPETSALATVTAEPKPSIRSEPVVTVQCLRFGPHDSADEALALSAQWAPELSSAFKVVTLDVAQAPRYRVALGPHPRALAAKLKDEIAGLNIDAALTGRGDELGVSVGVFSTLKRAEAQAQRVQELGYAATIKVLERWSEKYFLEGQIDPGSTVAKTANSSC